jgi:hypothetical protein
MATYENPRRDETCLMRAIAKEPAASFPESWPLFLDGDFKFRGTVHASYCPPSLHSLRRQLSALIASSLWIDALHTLCTIHRPSPVVNFGLLTHPPVPSTIHNRASMCTFDVAMSISAQSLRSPPLALALPNCLPAPSVSPSSRHRGLCFLSAT